MPNFLVNIISQPWIQAALAKIYNLNSQEIWVLIFIAALLILVLAFRTLGMKMVFVMLLLYLIAYVLYINDITSLYEKRVVDTENRSRVIEKELDKFNSDKTSD